MLHKIIPEGFRDTKEIQLSPPFPNDPFSYAIIENREWREVVTGHPYFTESAVKLSVPLGTTIFVESKRGKARPERELQVFAKVRSLRYSCIYYSYPQELPIKILGWEVKKNFCSIAFNPKDPHYHAVVIPPPSEQEVWTIEGKRWPYEPRQPLEFNKFYFSRWLQNKKLTSEDAKPLYEEEVLEPYRQAMADYKTTLVEARNYYRGWLLRNEVLLMGIEEIWNYLHDEVFPVVAKRVEEEARQILERAGHIDLFLEGG